MILVKVLLFFIGLAQARAACLDNSTYVQFGSSCYRSLGSVTANSDPKTICRSDCDGCRMLEQASTNLLCSFGHYRMWTTGRRLNYNNIFYYLHDIQPERTVATYINGNTIKWTKATSIQGNCVVFRGGDQPVISRRNCGSARPAICAEPTVDPVELYSTKFNQTYLLITNGNTGTHMTGKTEILSMSDEYPACQKLRPTNHMRRTRGAVGAYFHTQGFGRAIICGGVVKAVAHKTCYVLDYDGWKTHGETMKHARQYPAAVLMPNEIFWLLGGEDENNDIVRHSEYFDPSKNKWFDSPIVTPENIRRFCVAPINETHYFLTGGDDKVMRLNRSYIIDYSQASQGIGNWTEVASLDLGRENHMCGHAVMNGKNVVVIAGGQIDGIRNPRTNDVVIYDPETDSYSPGTPLPMNLDFAQVTPIGDSFYISGGRSDDKKKSEAGVYYFDETASGGAWNLVHTMERSRHSHNAIIVPNCCVQTIIDET